MKRLIVIMLAVLALTACVNRSNNRAVEDAGNGTAVDTAGESTVYVYYFHGKQRCKTCIAVEKIAKNAVSELYGKDSKVKYLEIQTDDEANKTLVEKYEVTWNALVVAKGGDSIDITKQAFANAVNSPEVLAELIKTEVDKRLDGQE